MAFGGWEEGRGVGKREGGVGCLTRKPAGDAGSMLRLTAQSIKVALPRMANTMVFMWSMGTDLITMALVPVRQSAST